MSATLKDVALAAQVSPATASLVLNGKGVISNETRERVLGAASQLNYGTRPRRAAKDGNTGTVLFLKIAKHGHTVNRDHSTFIADYIDGMSQEARRRGYKLEVVSHEGDSIERIAASLAQRAANGIIVLGTELSEADVRRLQATDRPIVFIDTHFDRIEANFVNMNNRDAVHRIVSYLDGQGFQRIGFVGSPVETVNFRLRHVAFLESMQLLKIALAPENIIMVDSTFEGAARDMEHHLRRGIALPDCLVCTNDIVAYGCIKALREANVRLPEDLSVVGFDNLPLSEVLEPPLTTVDVSKRKIGALAISILDDELRAAEPQPAVKALVGASLVVRGSVLAAGERADRSQLVRA